MVPPAVPAYADAAPANAVAAPSAHATLATSAESTAAPAAESPAAAIRHSPVSATLVIPISVTGGASRCHGTMSRPVREVSWASWVARRGRPRGPG